MTIDKVGECGDGVNGVGKIVFVFRDVLTGRWGRGLSLLEAVGNHLVAIHAKEKP